MHISVPLISLRRTARRRAAQCRPAQRLLASALAIPILLGVLAAPLTSPVPAEAATVGRMVSIGGWQVGAFLTSDGHYVYCIEPGAVMPSSNQKTVTTVSSLPGYSGGTFDPTGWRGTVTSGALSGTRLRQINYLLWTKGRTTDVGTAAAVQLAVWILRADPGVKPWLDHHLAWARAHGGGGYVDHARRLAKEARAKATAPSAPQPEALVIERAAGVGAAARPASLASAEAGTVRYPAGTTRLAIEGGEFADGTRQLAVEPGGAGVAEWRAVLHEPRWGGEHEVVITGEWEAAGEGWPAKVRIYPPETAGQQRLAAGVGPERTSFAGTNRAADAIDARFSPVLSSRVSERFVAEGAPFSDTVSLGAAGRSAAESGSGWPARTLEGGETEFAPVVADGTVYGPFDAPQETGAEPPAGAPVAGRARLVAADGPGEYSVDADRRVGGAGYYYWVWSIRESEQLPEVREGGLMPSNYLYADEFGLVAEGHVSPTVLRWRTRLERRSVTPDDLMLRDHLTAELEGGSWLRDESGAVVPARIRLTVYQTAYEPARQAAVPETARELARGFVWVREPGEEVAAEPIAIPATTRGWVTVQACLLAEDQPEEWRGYIEEWCDDYGVPEETARIEVPEVLSRTGGPARGELAVAPLLGLGLIGSGAGALLAGGLLRSLGRAGGSRGGRAKPSIGARRLR